MVVPSFYLIMDDLSWLLGKIFGRLVGTKEVEAAEPSAEVLAERIALLAADQADLREKVGELAMPMQDQRQGMAAE